MDPEELMRLAIEKCRAGIAAGQSPFGCAIARGEELLAVSHNTVMLTTDITAHAEMNALRSACQAADNIFLEETIVATTCEPCPMCMAALHWARVPTVYFGTSIADAEDAGFNELRLRAADLLKLGGSRVQLIPDMLADECRELFQQWKSGPSPRSY